MLEVIEAFKKADSAFLTNTVLNALGVAAPQVIALTARLSGIPEEQLQEDPDIGPSGIVEIIRTVWEINDLKNVVAALGQAKKALAPQTKHGSNG